MSESGPHRRAVLAAVIAMLCAGVIAATVPADAAQQGSSGDTPLPAAPAPDHALRAADSLSGGAGASFLVRVAPGTPIGRALAGHEFVDLSGPAFSGAVARLTERERRQVAATPGVTGVSRDQPVTAAAADPGKQPLSAQRARGGPAAAGTATDWGLDRTDQVGLPLDGRYNPPANGARVHAYVIDTGIDTSNREFAGRIGPGAYVTRFGTVADCDGHGTHVAGTIGSARYGMARAVVLHPVRVLDCDGSGYTSEIIAAINWVAANAPARSVVNLSLGGGFNWLENEAVAALIDRGLVVAVAAGNEGSDACDASPASEPSVLTVGAVDRHDRDTDFSNYGPCLDLYAPGVDITSTDWLGSSGAVMSGTSMASPHVAGAAAVYWSLHPNATGPQVQAAVLDQASRGVLSFPYGQLGSPNVNLNVSWRWAAGPPRRVKARAGRHAATVAWRTPDWTGGTRIRGYRVQLQRYHGAWHLVAAHRHGSSLRVTQLKRHTRYRFRVAALNGSGTGPFSLSRYVVTR